MASSVLKRLPAVVSVYELDVHTYYLFSQLGQVCGGVGGLGIITPGKADI